MSQTPLYVGNTHATLSVTWQDDTATAINLTGTTLSVKFNNGTTSTAGTGTFVLTTPASGQFTYAVSAADVATAGRYSLQFKALFGDATVLFSDPVELEIYAVY